MNTFKKNQIIITALAIMIAIAGYLNFTDKAKLDEDQYVFNNEPETAEILTAETGLVPNEESLLNVNVIEEPDVTATVETAETLVPDANATVEDPAATVEDPAAVVEVQDPDLILETAEADTPDSDIVGEAVFVSSSTVASTYFLEAKIEREQTRALSVDILMDVINNENLGEEQKVEAAAEMLNLQDRIEKEAAAESMLEAKGFEDVFVRMDETTVDVVVNAPELSETDLAQIADVVSRKTGVDPAQIVISPLKVQE